MKKNCIKLAVCLSVISVSFNSLANGECVVPSPEVVSQYQAAIKKLQTPWNSSMGQKPNQGYDYTEFNNYRESIRDLARYGYKESVPALLKVIKDMDSAKPEGGMWGQMYYWLKADAVKALGVVGHNDPKILQVLKEQKEAKWDGNGGVPHSVVDEAITAITSGSSLHSEPYVSSNPSLGFGYTDADKEFRPSDIVPDLGANPTTKVMEETASKIESSKDVKELIKWSSMTKATHVTMDGGQQMYVDRDYFSRRAISQLQSLSYNDKKAFNALIGKVMENNYRGRAQNLTILSGLYPSSEHIKKFSELLSHKDEGVVEKAITSLTSLCQQEFSEPDLLKKIFGKSKDAEAKALCEGELKDKINAHKCSPFKDVRNAVVAFNTPVVDEQVGVEVSNGSRDSKEVPTEEGTTPKKSSSGASKQ